MRSAPLKLASALMLSSAVLPLGLAAAQEVEQASGQESSRKLETVTVTARKVEENLQDVPVAVSAYTGATLERRQISGTDVIGKITPNLEFTNNAPLAGNNNSSQVFIRGIGQVDPRANTDPGVGIYIDDVYMGQSVGGTMEFRDIAGVQVLRGPQGTLFGRNTIGGAVVLTTTEPGDEYGGSLNVKLGSDNLRQVFAAVDAPLADNFRTRFTYGSKQQDGYVTRVSDGTDLGDSNNYTLTGKAVWEPTPDLTVKAQFDYTSADEHGAPLVFAAYGNNTDPNVLQSAAFMGARQSVLAGCPDAWYVLGGGPGRTIITAPVTNVDLSGIAGTDGAGTLTIGGPPAGYTAENTDPRCANNQWNAGPFSNNGTHPIRSTLLNRGMSLNITYDLSDAITLKSISAYRMLKWSGSRDGDNTPFTILHTDFHSSGNQFSQEFQALFDYDRLSGVLGAYYYEQEIRDILTVALGERDSLDSDNNSIDDDNIAFFTQWTYDVTDKLSLTGGVRYTEETKRSKPEQFDYASLADGVLTSVPVAVTAYDGSTQLIDNGEYYLPPIWYEQKFDATTISAALNYRWNEQVMTYVSYSEGFKSGGFNSSFNVNQTADSLAAAFRFGEENASSIEAGLKSDLLDNTLRFNAAVFTTDYEDLQFIFRTGPAPYLYNAGKASIDGAEVELTWIPSDAWIIEAGLGYLDDSIDEVSNLSSLPISPPLSTSVTTSNTLPYTPEIQANLGIGYTHDLGKFSLEPRVDVYYRDETYFDTANTPEIAQLDTVTTVDASIGLVPDIGRWSVVLGVVNLTDEVYPIAGNSSLSTGTGYAEVAYARPRQWFLTFKTDF